MPYIVAERRPKIVRDHEMPQTAGELNFAISQLVHRYLDAVADRKALRDRVDELRYSHINEVIGVLECAKLELYRTIASEIEDRKMNENGCVSKLDRPFWRKHVIVQPDKY